VVDRRGKRATKYPNFPIRKLSFTHGFVQLMLQLPPVYQSIRRCRLPPLRIHGQNLVCYARNWYTFLTLKRLYVQLKLRLYPSRSGGMPDSFSHYDCRSDITNLRPLKPPELYQECSHCKERTPHVYSRGWMCLNPECTKFWETESGDAPMDGLEYTENFLKLQPVPKLSSGCKSLLPSLPVAPSNKITTNYASTRGWHCIKCGRLSSR
jgi:hypothetical protein